MSNNKINKLISILDNQDLDALALVPGSNFRYATGGNFHLMERPTLFIVSKTYKPIAILPVLEVESFTQLNIEADIVEWQDSDGYQSAFNKVFNKLGSIAKMGVEGQRMRVFEMQAIEKSFQNIKIVNAQKLISNMRLLKDDQEIEHLKHAVKIAESALTDTIKFVSINKTEIVCFLILVQP
jgi:Xaa-Pro dipeptidase